MRRIILAILLVTLSLAHAQTRMPARQVPVDDSDWTTLAPSYLNAQSALDWIDENWDPKLDSTGWVTLDPVADTNQSAFDWVDDWLSLGPYLHGTNIVGATFADDVWTIQPNEVPMDVVGWTWLDPTEETVQSTFDFIDTEGPFLTSAEQPNPRLISGLVPQHSTDTAIILSPGYGVNGANYFSTSTNTTVDLTGQLPSGRGTTYIYVDNDSAFPDPTFYASTTAPGLQEAGWYSGLDRCIASVRSPASGATVHPFVAKELGGGTYEFHLAQGPMSATAGEAVEWRTYEQSMSTEETWLAPFGYNGHSMAASVPEGVNAVYLWALNNGTLGTTDSILIDIGTDESGAVLGGSVPRMPVEGESYGVLDGVYGSRRVYYLSWVPLNTNANERTLLVSWVRNDGAHNQKTDIRGWRFTR